MSNNVTLTIVGNLVADPELRFTPNGIAVANFTIAQTPRSFDSGKGEWVDADTIFMRCTVWREMAENAAESLTKGMRVIATGRLASHEWETRDGESRRALDLQIEDIGPSLRWATADVKRNAKVEEKEEAPKRGGRAGKR